jgi:threonine/homoserine/homoserine lactone efflux protein
LGGALVTIGVSGATFEQTAIFFASFMLGSALWALLLSLAIGKARRWMGPRFSMVVSIACGIALGSFGLIAASRVVYSLFGIR